MFEEAVPENEMEKELLLKHIDNDKNSHMYLLGLGIFIFLFALGISAIACQPVTIEMEGKFTGDVQFKNSEYSNIDHFNVKTFEGKVKIKAPAYIISSWKRD